MIIKYLKKKSNPKYLTPEEQSEAEARIRFNKIERQVEEADRKSRINDFSKLTKGLGQIKKRAELYNPKNNIDYSKPPYNTIYR